MQAMAHFREARGQQHVNNVEQYHPWMRHQFSPTFFHCTVDMAKTLPQSMSERVIACGPGDVSERAHTALDSARSFGMEAATVPPGFQAFRVQVCARLMCSFVPEPISDAAPPAPLPPRPVLFIRCRCVPLLPCPPTTGASVC